MILRRVGTVVSEKVIRRIMTEEQLIVISKRRRSYSAYLGEITPAVENIVQRDFHAEAPSETWLTDITEFQLPAGKAYPSPMIDCFDGIVVSWAIGPTIRFGDCLSVSIRMHSSSVFSTGRMRYAR